MNNHVLDKYTLLTYDHIDSTNTEAKRLSQAIIPCHIIIWGLNQTAGYGKMQRKWYSGKKDLTFSMIIPHKYKSELVGNFLFIAALAVFQTIQKLLQEKGINDLVTLKWPNDILLNGKKLCGILIENIESGKRDNYMIVGIGINISSSPVDIINNTCCLSKLNLQKDEIAAILMNIVEYFESYREEWKLNGLTRIREEWLLNAHGLGQKIIVNNFLEEIQGIFKTISHNGSIEIELDSGMVVKQNIGEIFFK